MLNNFNYIGSKKKLNDIIFEKIKKNVKGKIILDLFCGTGIISQKFNKEGYQVISNDLQYYSYLFTKVNVENIYENMNNILSLIFKLNNLKGGKGFFYKNYTEKGKRLYFTIENAMKIDSIRIEIENLYKNNKISKIEKEYLIVCLMKSADKVANTTSVYCSFLKKFKKSALKTLLLEPIVVNNKNKNNKVYNKEYKDLLKLKLKYDICYIDPPYNERQYAYNYHILETLTKYDNPKIKGVGGVRNYDNQKSGFSSRVKVYDELKYLISNLNCKYIIFSYNNQGILSKKEIMKELKKRGNTKLYKIPYKTYKADTKRDYNKGDPTEYLFICEVF